MEVTSTNGKISLLRYLNKYGRYTLLATGFYPADTFAHGMISVFENTAFGHGSTWSDKIDVYSLLTSNSVSAHLAMIPTAEKIGSSRS